MPGAGPSQAGHCAPSGGSETWGPSMPSAGPSQAGHCAPSGGSETWGPSIFPCCWGKPSPPSI